MAFVKGQSGNPGGRPKKGETLTDILRGYLNEPDPNSPPYTRKQMLAQALYSRAIEGDVMAIKYTYDRIDGKPVETVNSKQDGTVVLTFRSVDGSAPSPDDEDEGEGE